jgi:gliding motility-associated-like protein
MFEINYKIINLLKIVGTTVLSILFTVGIATAQGKNAAIQGECCKLRVSGQSGSNYLWKIYSDRNLLNEVSTSDAEFVGENSGKEVIVKWNKVGEYYFTVNAFNSSGCSNLKVGKMDVLALPLVSNAGVDTTIGSCRQMILDGSESQGDIIQYKWTVIEPGGIIINPGNKIAEFSLSSTYEGVLPANFHIRLSVSDKFGNTDSDTIAVEIDSRPMAKIVFSDIIDRKDYKILNGSNSLGTKISFMWDTSDGAIIGENNQPEVTVKVPGMYGLLVRDKYGCESSVARTVNDLQRFLITKPDYGRCSWAEELIIPVLDNDYSSDNKIIAGSVMITKGPTRGKAIVLNDGVVKYVPSVNTSCRDKFEYKVFDEFNLCDSAEVIVDVFDAPVVKPYGFSPNGDGINDLLVFQNLGNYPDSKLIVFTINGQIIYKSDNYTNDWDGKTTVGDSRNRTIMQTGTYYYILRLGGTTRTIKGFIYIVY